jgi:CelD/BcsL family acetyltransferase involved in cellulose biosynthesis
MSLDLALPAVASTTPAPSFASVRVFTDMREAQQDWAELERVAPHSAYQRRDWILPWLGSIGRARKVSPAVALARGCDGAPLALLPLCVMSRGPFRLAEFLGGKDANFGLGLFRPGVRFERADLVAFLNGAAAATPGGIDLFALVNQPREWEGVGNPFLAIARNASPAEGYKTALAASGEAFLKAKLSRDTRKKMRRKEERLGELGPVRHIRAEDADQARAILSVFHAQKSRRMKDKGLDNVFDGPAAEEFLARVSIEPLERGRAPAVELHALLAGERIVATFAGAGCGRRFSGMFNSFDMSEEVARCSPGDLLLSKILSEKCDAGLATFDLGVGEARYKRMFCGEVDPLFDAFHPVTAGGRALMWVKGAKRDAKRMVKHNPRLWRAVEALRRLRG